MPHPSIELSVIIPVYAPDSASVLLLCNALHSLKTSTFQNFEILVADDASPLVDAVGAIAAGSGVRLVRLDQRSGPAAARNAASRQAAADILLFLDADTSVHPDTLERFAAKFRDDPELAAVIGSYDQQPSAPGVVSRFRNLLHSFVHHRADPRATTFWAGCGAVRKNWFQTLGGFDESFTAPSIEDVEFGLRLNATGAVIQLDPDIQVTHHKRWTLASMIRTDLLARAIPWAGLLRRYSLPSDLNFNVRDRLAVALAPLTFLLTGIALLHGGRWAIAPAIALTVIALLHWPLLRFVQRAAGWRDAVLGFPVLFVYLSTCAAGLIAGMMAAEHRRDRYLWPATCVIGALLLALLVTGGAFQAEFTGHPDEAAQFVSGLMLYDYFAALPAANPIAWFGQYYLHYPKVALGHWPPGYHLMEAGWQLLFGPSRTSSMLLQWLIGLIALVMLYRLCRFALPLPVTAGILALTMATPVFQQSLEQAMADLCCLLWSMLVMHASVRLVEKQDRMSVVLLAVWLFAAALTKGTAICLVPVPALALLAAGRPIRLSPRLIAAGGLCLLVAATWYLANGGITAWGGMSFQEPWPGKLIGTIAGWGFLALAAFGVRRHPLALVSAGLIASTLGVSFFVRAMREDRHWIIVLPAILILAGFALVRLQRVWMAAPLLVAALALFPWHRYVQYPSDFAKLAGQFARPARMLISSAGPGEGPWIAVCALGEARPGSFILRASKVLAESGWTGEGYHLLTPDGPAVLRRLDEFAVNVVILHSPRNPNPRPHHALLRDAVAGSTAWIPCGGVPDLIAYCRIDAPRFLRRPLRLRAYGWEFTEQASPTVLDFPR